MRNPERIDGYIEQLRSAWKANPDLRLGQLVYNAARANRPIDPCPGLFYIEDGPLIGGLFGQSESDRTPVEEAIAAWEKTGPTSTTVALMADALYGVKERGE